MIERRMEQEMYKPEPDETVLSRKGSALDTSTSISAISCAGCSSSSSRISYASWLR